MQESPPDRSFVNSLKSEHNIYGADEIVSPNDQDLACVQGPIRSHTSVQVLSLLSNVVRTVGTHAASDPEELA